MCFGCSKEPSHRDGSFEYSQHMFWMRNKKNKVPTGQGNLVFLQGQGKVREFCKMVREIRKSTKVREKSGNFKIMLG